MVYRIWADRQPEVRHRGKRRRGPLGCDLGHVPLLSLETASPLASFDVIGFTLAHELVFTNILEALDLAGIAFRADERDEDDPLVFGGGPSA